MNKKYIKENKKLVKEFIGALVKAVVQKKADKFIKKLSKDPENKSLIKEFLGTLIKAVAKRQANKLVKDLRKQSPENAKAIDDMHKLASDINRRIKDLEKTNPAKAKILKQKIGF